MAKGENVPPEDEATRWIKPKLLGKDDDNQVVVDTQGRPTVVAPSAFALADDEESISITWLQCFGLDRSAHLPKAAEAFRLSIPSQTLSAKGAFAIAHVAEVIAAGKDHGLKLRVVQDPVDGNAGHAEIRRYPREMGLLQTMLATQVFGERYLYGDIKQKGWHPMSK